MDIRCSKCPGQERTVKGPEDVEFECPNCHEIVEIWPPAVGEKCPHCGNWVSRGGNCADWCQYAKECLGEERYKKYQESKNMTHCCGHHNCIEELRSDHEKILAELDKLEADPAGHAKEFLEFTESFAEPHHQKEEQVLYPAMEEKGIPREGGPIGVMLTEHEIKRGHVKDLRKTVKENNSDSDGIREHALAIISLLRDHISKENDILYPMAEQVLSAEELAGLGHKCEEVKNRK